MGTVLFKLFGFDVTWKLLLRLGIGIAAAVVLYLAYDAVRDHFAHIDEIEQQNETLKSDKVRLEGQLEGAVETNRQNQETAKANDEIRQNNQEIAAAERAAATARAQTYREIRNAINSASPPATAQPVAPVILDTLERLWGPGSTAGNPGGRSGSDGLR
jgi:hypothetical protein